MTRRRRWGVAVLALLVAVAGPARLVVQGGDLEALGAGWQPVRLGAGIGWLRPGEA